MSKTYIIVLCLAMLVVPSLLLALAWSPESRASLLGFLELALRRFMALFHPRPALAWIGWARKAHRGTLARAFVAEAARTGDPEGVLEEGLLYWEGGWGAGGKEPGSLRFQRAAEGGLPDAMYWFAEDLYWGGGRLRDPAASLHWLRKGAQAGSGACMVSLARRLRDGLTPEAEAEATRWEERLAASGADPTPRRSVAVVRAGEVEPDLLVRAAGAALGTVEAWFERPEMRPLLPWLGWTAILLMAGTVVVLLALPFFYGSVFVIPLLIAFAMLLPMAWRMHMDHRPSEAIRHHLDAAQAGDAQAAYRMGMACLRGSEGLPKEPGEARRWLRIAAEAGHLEAMVELSALLSWDLGGHRDPVGSEAWLRRAAEAGHEGAMARLAERSAAE